MNKMLDHLYEKVIGDALYPLYETALRGRKTFLYKKECERNQWLSPQEIRNLQWDRLKRLIRHAYDTVSHYRESFDRWGICPENISSPDDFARLPILDKATIRKCNDQLISSVYDFDNLIRSATGGSTGEPMQFFYDRNSYERRMAAAMRGDGWAGWRLCAPEFYLWGAQLAPESGFKRRKRLLYQASLRRLTISSFGLSKKDAPDILRQINHHRPKVVVGFANALYEFSRYVAASSLKIDPPEGIISSAEMLYDHQRELIEKVFQAPVYNRYGCREVMMIGAECATHQGFHVTADHLYIEIVKDGRLCSPGESGDILLTDLFNYGMPLIRYKVGDLGSWDVNACPCGRGLPLLKSVDGRELDVIRLSDDKIISGEFFPHLFKDFAAIQKYQVIQETMQDLVIYAQLSRHLEIDERKRLTDAVEKVAGADTRIHWKIGESVDIPSERKYRPVISRVNAKIAKD